MQTVIPITTYSIRSSKPTTRFGSPGQIPLMLNAAKSLLRLSMDKVPVDAVITSAILSVYTQRNYVGTPTLRVYPNTAAWNSSVTWSKRPAIGALIQSVVMVANPLAGTQALFDVTAWAITRSRNGLTLDTDSVTNVWTKGSAYDDQRPVLTVNYTVTPDTPSNLMPDGGAVSVAKPILTYTGETEMTQQKIQYSNDGIAITVDTGWLSATSGLLDPAVVAGTPALTAGQSVYWRVQTNGPNGNSPVSPWAQYSYQPLPVVTILNPPATTDDGSPTLQWSVVPAGAQDAWQATFNGNNGAQDHSGWEDNADTDWTPGQSVKVPNGVGTFVLKVQDALVRVAAAGAPTEVTMTRQFTTVLVDTGTAVDTIDVEFDDPIPKIVGTRVAGIPDLVGLFRDDVQVTLWDPVDGTPYKWAPAVNFFTGTAFHLLDYTCDLKHDHTWKVRVKVGTATAAGGPTASGMPFTDSVWLVDPRSDERVEIFGYNQLPVVDQGTTEGSIIHTPVHGDLLVEEVRRRLMRTTQHGSVSGLVWNNDEDTLNSWVLGDSGKRYRLIFGKVNWPVILGDYSQSDMFYPEGNGQPARGTWAGSPPAGTDRILMTCNWWQRLQDY